ncbi:related to Probable serine/threonine-protein kinase COQ8, mitochondrial [Saccharomycodes ludwigii]|uniref:Related to Probable serine/threonine-protein kinase COQ8, mitochondrial n=1 Tax=Saccharomycodes ludwigii TaxID=36035 RepID=A0A376B8B6_9ASCO|nr:hypothetical protein SCDLUD_001013 [Saccharomycodes ludwigii]KAH3903380.1 hypothetical protein SCDLUD_001013 [Saccharomycodes ludwigii]SSD60908.1 related to Probable serine/threonine-protein kinase COQ8, mitochondrial [Saccharomycodes ludwigii]
MATRKCLYDAFCVLSSSKQVLHDSTILTKEAICTWVKTSTITTPLLSQFQWFNDPKWEEATRLSESVKNGTYKSATNSINYSSKPGTRSFSTSIRRLNDDSNKKKNEIEDDHQPKNQLESSEVPTSRLSRLFHYGSLAAGVGMSAATQGISQLSKGKKPDLKSLILSDANINRITKKFSKMRGAALKIGQMLSFQDEKVLPRELYEILSRVQNGANYMPIRQLNKVMSKELKDENWESKCFQKFNKIPMAAASIGQVHDAVLADGTEVVVKVQYPGVKESIDSDLNNLLMLLTASRLLPKGLFLDKTVENARTELKWECDYLREARCLKAFARLLKDDNVFEVPKVFDELTTESIITMTKMQGIEIMKLQKSASLTSQTRDFVCGEIMRLCLEEIAEFKYMQTDPNWANFLYNGTKIELLDFGACREYPQDFITKYRKMLTAATLKDRDTVQQLSQQLGYLTGLESQAMVDAHVNSVMVLGEPFATPGLFDFSNQTVTDRIRGNIGLMLNERLCPPPEETYSLHRKFSGVFLLCAKMGGKVPCADLFSKYFALKD